MNIDIVKIDYNQPLHAKALIDLLDAYAMDPMGGSHPLSAHARQNLVAALAQRPTAFGVLAFAEGEPAGLVNCFEGFSTFACKPLVNIHDVVVLPAYRGQKIAHRMLRQVEQLARERGCCKLTLEVLQGNRVAQQFYRAFGFDGYSLLAENGNAVFLQKILSD
ncbi:MAG TPA: GNAT family N-acetyltransferase [Burkholderiaceae bacterium]|nr:GNAT family N-acetyltransferase [Burkholderiaceae bacterium]